jgi:hypothetical protein
VKRQLWAGTSIFAVDVGTNIELGLRLVLEGESREGARGLSRAWLVFVFCSLFRSPRWDWRTCGQKSLGGFVLRELLPISY